MEKVLLTVFLVFMIGFTNAQDNKRPFSTKKELSVIFDTDMGNDIDDTLALDMLFKYMDQGKVNLLGIE